MGDRVGTLSAKSAAELGLRAGIPVAVSVIDAHAGGIGLLGGTLPGEKPRRRRVRDSPGPDRRDLELSHGGVARAALRERRVGSVLLRHAARYVADRRRAVRDRRADRSRAPVARALSELTELAQVRQTTVYALLNERLAELGAGNAVPGALTRDMHVLPDHHGNRSPRADPSLRGMISGLKLSASVDQLALEYLATIQAIAHGTRHIIDTLNAHGYRIETLLITGGDSKNPVFLREHADATGARLLLPREPEAVLLGSAILAARAADHFPSVVQAMAQMSSVQKVIEPSRAAHAFHEGKHRVFLRMHEDQLAYRKEMAEL